MAEMIRCFDEAMQGSVSRHRTLDRRGEPVGRIRTIRIHNYRSVGAWVEITFPQRGPLVLFGPNNAGKSNIVRALDLILGEGWPGSHQPQDHEYHLRDSTNLPIQINLDVEDVVTRFRDGLFEVSQITWRFDPEEPERPVAFDVWSPEGLSRWATNSAREQCFCMVIGADRRLAYQLGYSSRWTLLSKLMRRFHSSLVGDEDRVQRLQALFGQVVETFYEVEPFTRFSEDLKRNAAEIGASLEYGLELDFSAYDPSNFFHSLRVRPHTAGEVRTFEELGTGQEQILAIAFAYSYARAFGASGVEGLLLIIEEPEAHLHPLAQTWLARKMNELAQLGVQVMITTHSPAFLDLGGLDGLCRVGKSGEAGATEVVQRTTEELATFCSAHGAGAKATPSRVVPFYAASATEQITGGLFGRAVLLVEGPTEALALPVLLRHGGLDLVERGIATIPVNGIGCLARWWRFFGAYEVPTYVIFDRDSDDDRSGIHRADLLRTLSVDQAQFEASVRGTGLVTAETYAALVEDFESALRSIFAGYEFFESQGRERLGSSAKPLVARYACEHLEQDDPGWAHLAPLAEAIRARLVAA
jgi:putative ATP-dependent endonuclease of OLD family